MKEINLSDIPEKYAVVKCPLCGLDVNMHSFSHTAVVRMVELDYICSTLWQKAACGAVFRIMWEYPRDWETP